MAPSSWIIRLVAMMYVGFPLSLRNTEDMLFERGIEVSYETVRFWWNRFGPMFAPERKADHRRVRKVLADLTDLDSSIQPIRFDTDLSRSAV
jgi:transposase-like protein